MQLQSPVPVCCRQELPPPLPRGLGTLTHGRSAPEQLPPASLIQEGPRQCNLLSSVTVQRAQGSACRSSCCRSVP